MQTQSFGNALTSPFFLFPLLHNAERHALLLKASKCSVMLSVPDGAVMFMVHAIDWVFPGRAQKAASYIAFCTKTYCLLQPYWSITAVFLWLITI